MAKIKLTYDTPEVQAILDSVANKVDKVEGMGLSSNDYTDGDKTTVESLGDVTTLLHDFDELVIDGGTSGVI